MNRLLPTIVAGACALAALAPSAALARKPTSTKSYYLALGDSLSRGAQPNAAGKTVPTANGYTNFLYATEKSKIKGLTLAELGCLGESTKSMQKGGICHYAGGSQLAAALRFIATHKIAFVTLDIGANDVDFCAHGSTVDATCISKGVASISKNTPKIVKALRKAVGAKIKIVGMTCYDPFLADYLNPSTRDIAALSVTLAKSVNQSIVAAFRTQKVKVADVATAFDTYTPFTTTARLPGHGTVPVAVAQICELTWMCAAAPRGPNIHANTTGYRSIANVFATQL